MTALKKFAVALMFAMVSTLLSSCQAADDTMGLDVVGYNHTDHSIGDFSVNGEAGSFLARHSGGGGFACCVSLPSQYTPGMSVTVTWTDTYNAHPQSRVVVVPLYTPEDGGHFAVHFLRNGQIKVFVTMYYPEHPNYPLKGDEVPM
ncbi:DUF3304 domain-containing protein [Dyella caseinilytica]|uniref:DUF3304 domain-containing protein n=1 Tax=Dyella caseinilytica TaxID=1849581 RepID=A0ABX7GUP9_9GAMM|nr:DUF3304 domain-containing protein [Dyella caseinilytica]QRN54188.1 DUF3304 domain-containing protein [Dyella caseinilytica]GFZ92196.1 hypothetical protein GCM10011408_09630 [Dyella caseinilytica]